MTIKYLPSLAMAIGLAFNITAPAHALTSNFSTGAIVDATLDGGTTAFTTTATSGTPISLSLDLTHANLSDLEIYLTSPSGDILSIATLLRGNGQITPTLIDSGSSSIDVGAFPYNGSFRPDESGFAFSFLPTVVTFSAFGIQAAGTYTLTINDLTVGNSGNLNSASLNLDPATPVPFEFSPAIGLAIFGTAFALKKLATKVKK